LKAKKQTPSIGLTLNYEYFSPDNNTAQIHFNNILSHPEYYKWQFLK